MSTSEARRSTPWAYWALAIVLVAFGAVAIFSIGLPFLALGLTLIAVAPLRHAPSRFWPLVVAVIAFFAAWWVLGPVACVAETTPSGGERRWCESLVGVTYAGSPTWIGPTFGVVGASLAYVGLHLALRPPRTRASRPETDDD